MGYLKLSHVNLLGVKAKRFRSNLINDVKYRQFRDLETNNLRI
ncbi:MAG: hypothetical protein ACI85O_001155 [Saprospiraceae bacterium]|jgi:hypothetical protein